MLIPELSDLQQLEDATVTKALAGRSQTNVNRVCLCTGYMAYTVHLLMHLL